MESQLDYGPADPTRCGFVIGFTEVRSLGSKLKGSNLLAKILESAMPVPSQWQCTTRRSYWLLVGYPNVEGRTEPVRSNAKLETIDVGSLEHTVFKLTTTSQKQPFTLTFTYGTKTSIINVEVISMAKDTSSYKERRGWYDYQQWKSCVLTTSQQAI